MPKSRVRSKAVYTPPPRSSKAKVSPPVAGPGDGGIADRRPGLDRGLHVSQQDLPVKAFGQGNLVVGFAFLVTGVVLSTKWH